MSEWRTATLREALDFSRHREVKVSHVSDHDRGRLERVTFTDGAQVILEFLDAREFSETTLEGAECRIWIIDP